MALSSWSPGRALIAGLPTLLLALAAAGGAWTQSAPVASSPAPAPAQPSAPAAPTITDPTQPSPPAKPTSGPPSAFTFTVAYTADLVGDIAGGVAKGGGYADLFKASAAYDGGAQGHDGLTGLISVEHEFGSGFTGRRVGAIQAISSSEVQPGALRLYELWLQQLLFGGRGGVKAGLIDVNTTFDVQETAALFLNGSSGIGPDISDTGRNGPSDYPTPALALTAFYRPADDWTVQGGVFDGTAGDPDHRSAFAAVRFEGALLIAQAEKRFGDAARVEAGAWTYTGRFPLLTKQTAAGAGPRASGNAGIYALVEGRLLASPGGLGGGLSGWIRGGVANGDINPVANYLGAGVVYTAPIKGRDKDAVGLALSRAGLGAGARHVGQLNGRNIGSAETNLEVTYRYVIADWLYVQPDVQYVIDPHGDRGIPNALVAGVRFAFTYSK